MTYELNDESDPQMPQGLTDALGDLYDAKLVVPDEVNQRIMTAAREHLDELPGAHSIPIMRYMRWGLATAASVGLVSGLLWLQMNDQPDPVGPVAIEDIDASGGVDILDAFVVARHVRDGLPFSKSMDVNGDGTIDKQDIRQIAMRAVTLNGVTSGGAS